MQRPGSNELTLRLLHENNQPIKYQECDNYRISKAQAPIIWSDRSAATALRSDHPRITANHTRNQLSAHRIRRVVTMPASHVLCLVDGLIGFESVRMGYISLAAPCSLVLYRFVYAAEHT